MSKVYQRSIKLVFRHFSGVILFPCAAHSRPFREKERLPQTSTAKNAKKKTAAKIWTPARKAAAIERILDGVSSGRSVASLMAEDKNLPSFPTWYDWLKEDEGLAKNYARAMEARADITFDRLADLAGQVREGGIDPQAAKVAADIEKWTLARMRPKAYGDRQEIDHVSRDGSMSPVPTIDLSGLTSEMVERLEKSLA
jgi:hypothetical protein